MNSPSATSRAPNAVVPAGMQLLSGGNFTMGSEHFYTEEAPTRRVWVDPFLIDETPVTNAEFARFVTETGYVTLPEIAPNPSDYPGISPDLTRAGSAVFERTQGPVNTADPTLWWHFRSGADWRHPVGPESSVVDLGEHPVVHVAYADAEAFARWAGKSLPTEAEWEFAARGGLEGSDYAWGDELAPGGAILANYWQGSFPYSNQSLDGWERTSPVRTYPENGYGLYDMIGNVWEWTADWYDRPRAVRKTNESCCIAVNPRGGRKHDSYDPLQPIRLPRKVLKGGSHLCAANYCKRYRPAARHPQTIDTSTSHIGFRCVVRRRSSGRDPYLR